MAQAADVRRLAGTLLLAWLAASEAPPSAGCPGLVQYRLTLATAWTASRFPRHYPKWRPPAQWSQLFGESPSLFDRDSARKRDLSQTHTNMLSKSGNGGFVRWLKFWRGGNAEGNLTTAI